MNGYHFYAFLCGIGFNINNVSFIFKVFSKKKKIISIKIPT